MLDYRTLRSLCILNVLLFRTLKTVLITVLNSFLLWQLLLSYQALYTCSNASVEEDPHQNRIKYK